MNDEGTRELAFKAEVQRKVLANCISNLHKFFRSRNWETLHHKFGSLGLVLPSDLISCKICENDLDGYYFYKQKKIVMCANNVLDDNFSKELTRQLVNTYDDARAEIDPSNPNHIACSTIRGVNLGGECSGKSIYTGILDPNHYSRCVKERSAKLMTKNKRFNLNYEDAEDLVSEIWETCFHDYEPFSLEEYRKRNPSNSS